MSKFIKLGNKVINTDAIAYVDLERLTKCLDEHIASIRIYFNSPAGCNDDFACEYLDFPVESIEAKALQKYFSSSNNVIDLVYDVC